LPENLSLCMKQSQGGIQSIYFRTGVKVIMARFESAAFVLNACNPRVAETGQSRKALERHPYPVAPVEIGSRQVYCRALTSGSTVIEFEPRGKAAQEISELWRWIKAQMEKE
jgi:hypothetical protein